QPRDIAATRGPVVSGLASLVELVTLEQRQTKAGMRVDVGGHVKVLMWAELVGWVERSETHRAIASNEIGSIERKLMGFAALNPSYNTLHFRWMDRAHRHGADKTLDVVAPGKLGARRKQRRRAGRHGMTKRILQIVAGRDSRHQGGQEAATGTNRAHRLD